jgi:hypothetical protein
MVEPLIGRLPDPGMEDTPLRYRDLFSPSSSTPSCQSCGFYAVWRKKRCERCQDPRLRHKCVVCGARRVHQSVPFCAEHASLKESFRLM